jgi:Co/Zn/Cd efflux system component
LGGSSILAALFNAMLLLVAVGAIAWEAVLRLFHPEPVRAAPSWSWRPSASSLTA